MIDVCVVADVRFYQEGVAQMLAADERFRVIATASGPAEALARAAALPRPPDVTLIDIGMAGAFEGIAQLRERLPGMGVIALAVREVEGEIVTCAEAGVDGIVPRSASLELLLETVASVAHGESLCTPRVAAALLRRVAALAGERSHAGAGGRRRLTERERDIAELLDRGLSNKEIATLLHISLPTVKNHVHHILGKLGVTRRGEAVAALRGDPVAGEGTRS